jgi:hypothetical protein
LTRQPPFAETFLAAWRVEFPAWLDWLQDCLKSGAVALGAIIFDHDRFDLRILHKTLSLR